VTGDSDLEDRFTRFVEHHVVHGSQLAVESLVEGRPDLAAPLRTLIERYLGLNRALETGFGSADAETPVETLPAFEGFRTIERLGAGGMGQVFKLQDLTLDRVVAAKVVRSDRRAAAPLADFLREARSMALFKDRRIVQIFEFRAEADPPAIIMEFVDGFELGRIGPSL